VNENKQLKAVLRILEEL